MISLRPLGRMTVAAFVALGTACCSFAQSSQARPRPTAPACPPLPSEIAAARTLDQPCYSLTGYTSISGNVTIEPGVTIVASQNAAIHVKDNGSLKAIGTAEKQIIFRGKSPIAGSWQGISFGNVSAGNRLSYVHVEDAGQNNGSSSGAIFIFGAAGIDHSVIANSATVGLRVDSIARLLDFTANRLERNDVPLSIPAEFLGKIDGATEFAGNKQQIVSVQHGEVTSAATWHALQVPVAFESHAQIGAAITIEPGLTMTFANSTAVYVQHGGSLHAVGTAEKPIVFTGRGELPGAWSGLALGTVDSRNVLEYVHVDYAGDANQHAAIAVGVPGEAYVQIRNVRIAHSQYNGILVNRSSRTLPAEAALATANSFVDCGGEQVTVK